ncbi:MAG: hypothetical protein AAB539_04290 [Patescibacteria group bacterium]
MKPVIFLSLIFFATFSGVASAQVNPFDIAFPIAELGHCGSMEECRVYCDDAGHADACAAWAQAHGLSGTEEGGRKKDLPSGGGPGGCQSRDACEKYCSAPDHYTECADFAVEHGYASEGEGQGAPEQGQGEGREGPGGCKSPVECEAFCMSPDNQSACIDYAEKNGFMSHDEAERARKFRGKGGQMGMKGPGGCASEEECHRYCAVPDRAEECLRFAVENGFMSADEAKRASGILEARIRSRIPRPPTVGRPHIEDKPEIDVEKARKLLEEKAGPGGCKSFDECEAFCSAPENSETCFQFAVDNGLMGSVEAERMKKMMAEEGPGGCKGRACERYCEEFGHEDECLDFARREGFIKDDEFRTAQKFLEASRAGGPGGCKGRACERYCEDPAHRKECFEFAKKHQLMESADIEAIEHLEKMFGEGKSPGGCRSEDECTRYCNEPPHFNECTAFAVESGFVSQDEAQKIFEDFIGAGMGGERVGIPPDGSGVGHPMPEGFRPPAGMGGGSGQGVGTREEFERQYKMEFERRYEEEFRRRMGEFQQFRGQFGEGGQGMGMPAPPMLQHGEPGTGSFPMRPPEGGAGFPVPSVGEPGGIPIPQGTVTGGLTPPESGISHDGGYLPPQGVPPEGWIPPPGTDPAYGGIPSAEELQKQYGIAPTYTAPSGAGETTSGASVPPSFSGNSAVVLEPQSAGEYENTKFTISARDPEGIREIGIQTAGGTGVYAASPECAPEVHSGVLTLGPSDFPLGAYIVDCMHSEKFFLRVPGPALPPPQSRGFSVAQFFGTALQGFIDLLSW